MASVAAEESLSRPPFKIGPLSNDRLPAFRFNTTEDEHVVDNSKSSARYFLALLLLGGQPNIGCTDVTSCDELAPSCAEPATHLLAASPASITIVHRSVTVTETMDGCAFPICQRSGFEFKQVGGLVAYADSEIMKEALLPYVVDDDDWIVVLNGDDITVSFFSPDEYPATICVRDLDTKAACAQIFEPTDSGAVLFYRKNAESPLTVAGDSGRLTVDF